MQQATPRLANISSQKNSDMASAMNVPIHPYYPIDLEIVGYLANEWDTLTLVSLFAAGCTAIFLVTYLVVMRVQPKIPSGDLWTIMWFVLCR